MSRRFALPASRTLLSLLCATGVHGLPELTAQEQLGTLRSGDLFWTFDNPNFSTIRIEGDHRELIFVGGFRIRSGDLEIRGERGLATFDLDEAEGLADGFTTGGSALPRRGAEPAPSRRLLTEEVLRSRLQRFLQSSTTDAPRRPGGAEQVVLRLFRTLYLEGGVSIIKGGIEVARADRISVSALDDRMVFENVLLRLVDQKDPERMLVVRGPRLVRQGRRIVGRDVSVTTCDAGQAHVAVVSDEVEILERGQEFEVRSRGSSLQLHGVSIVPLPNASFYTNDQSQIPLRGASGGYSDREGMRAQLDFGSSMNRTGGQIHQWLTGRPAEEFRGDWRLGLGWIEKRGFPVDGGLSYRGEGLYQGSFDGFLLDDEGSNLREIRNNIDGSPITRSGRWLYRTENRIHLSRQLSLDLSAFDASDAAVYSEFQRREYRETELPETSLHLRHAHANRIATLTGRINAADFSYADNLALSPSFVEERPVATFDWIAEPIFTLPGNTPLLFSMATNVGQLRRKYDPLAPSPVDDETTRLDQGVELAAPFLLGPLRLRPYLSARVTWFDSNVDGNQESRHAFEVGVAASSRFSRNFHWINDAGSQSTLRHLLHPTVAVFHRFGISDPASDFFQFDEIDALSNRAEIRFELLQRLLHVDGTAEVAKTREVLWLDLAQPVTPISGRDNAGHRLAPFEYELLVRAPEFVPLPNTHFLLEGEHDWNERRLRTFNTGIRFGPVAKVDWYADYRTDHTSKGSISYGGATDLLGRFTFGAGAQYDLERKENLAYGAELIRSDHDWRIILALDYDIIGDDLSFTINFEPMLRGLQRARDRRYVPGNRFRGSADLTAW